MYRQNKREKSYSTMYGNDKVTGRPWLKFEKCCNRPSYQLNLELAQVHILYVLKGGI